MGGLGCVTDDGGGAVCFGSRTFSTGLAAFMRSIGFFGAGAGARKRHALKPTAASRQAVNRVLRMGVFGLVRQMAAEFPDFRVEGADLVAQLLVVAGFLG